MINDHFIPCVNNPLYFSYNDIISTKKKVIAPRSNSWSVYVLMTAHIHPTILTGSTYFPVLETIP